MARRAGCGLENIMTPKNLFIRVAAVLPVIAFVSNPAVADVVPNALFSDGAVLQRGQVVPVWGTADDGEKVTVELGNQKVSTTAQGGEMGGVFIALVRGQCGAGYRHRRLGQVSG
jgi:sialate O-acetylesterase